MLMNLVGPRFTSPPTTQVKASNEQRSGNGLNQAEDLALRQMRDLNTFMGKIQKEIQTVQEKGGTPTNLEAIFESKWKELNRLGEEHSNATAVFRTEQPTFYPVTGPMTAEDWKAMSNYKPLLIKNTK